MSDEGNTFEFNPTEKAEILQLIRDEISMFVLKGPGWFGNHDPLQYHRCNRCKTLIPMGQGCPCEMIGNTRVILPGGPS